MFRLVFISASFISASFISASLLLMAVPALSQPPASHSAADLAQPPNQLDLDPKLIEQSPVLQRWRRQVPNVLEDIKRDPAFRSRLRLGYSLFPSSNDASGFHVGVEDVFLGRTGLTLSADYQRSGNGKREA